MREAGAGSAFYPPHLRQGLTRGSWNTPAGEKRKKSHLCPEVDGRVSPYPQLAPSLWRRKNRCKENMGSLG